MSRDAEPSLHTGGLCHACTSTTGAPIPHPPCSALSTALGTPRSQAPALATLEPGVQCVTSGCHSNLLWGVPRDQSGISHTGPEHGGKLLSSPWHPEHPAERWHPTCMGTLGPSLGTPVGSLGRKPWGPTGGASSPPECQRWLACGHLRPSSCATKPVPGRTWEWKERTSQRLCYAPRACWLPAAEMMAQTASAAGPIRPSRSRHFWCPEPLTPPSPGLCHQHPQPAAEVVPCPLHGPPGPPSAPSHPPWWPRDLMGMPKGDEPPPDHNPQSNAKPLGATVGLRRAASRPLLLCQGAQGGAAEDAIHFWGACRSPPGTAHS